MIVKGRLAPSPTGALHIGNARTFLLTWLSVRLQDGVLALRIEDLDHPKVKPEHTGQLLDALRWLGLDWDGEPVIQSRRKRLYAEAIERLCSKNLIYPCVCSRKDVENAAAAPHAEDGQEQVYPGTCRDRFASYQDAVDFRPDPLPAWRFRTCGETTAFVDGFHGTQERVNDSDFVLARSPDGAGYALAVVVDDAAMGITEVLRGDDLLDATHHQLLLYRALGLVPPRFIHVPLVVGPDGRRLAKRHGDTRLSTLRANGLSPDTLVGTLAASCGLVPPGTSLHPQELLATLRHASAPFLSTLPRHPVTLV
ncbi:MAG: tRNA glutamyl-Q(34) synthetase GluQRS [Kiritimatiellaeota bacterium]|nr:tRNA glutamyl-Q(34) synthetase GluQRS [Kiritimatiellota bacterium]